MFIIQMGLVISDAHTEVVSIPRTIYQKNGLAGLRNARGMKVGYVARQIGVGYGTICEWEREGTKLSRFAQMSLASFYGVPVEAIREAIGRAEA